MDRHQLDALAYPVKSVGAPPIGTADSGVADNNISAVTGLPAIVVPAGANAQGLPIAVEFLGRPFSEPSLVAIAHGFEQATRARVPPPSTPNRPGERFAY
jgi:amidase